MCGNTVISNAISPDGKWNALLFERNCGATTDHSSQISLLKSGKSLENENGNVFAAAGYPEGYTLSWESNNLVKILGVNGKVYKKESQLHDIKFNYE